MSQHCFGYAKCFHPASKHCRTVKDISNSLHSFNNESNTNLDKLYSHLKWSKKRVMEDWGSWWKPIRLERPECFPKKVCASISSIYIFIQFQWNYKNFLTDIKILLFSIYISTENNLWKEKFPLRYFLIFGLKPTLKCVSLTTSRISRASLISVTKTDVNRSSTKSPT